MKSWTRTLNFDDAHNLLACAVPGLTFDAWRAEASPLIEHLSQARKREIFRILRDQFLDWSADGRIENGLFLRSYMDVPASVQIQMLHQHWALSHDITLLVLRDLASDAVASETTDIALADLDAVVARYVDSTSAESLRKTRTVLLGALEATGTIVGRGTGQHRTLRAARTRPHPLVYAYLVQRELYQRGTDAMMESEAIETSLGSRATLCPTDWARYCVAWAVEHGKLVAADDSISLPE